MSETQRAIPSAAEAAPRPALYGAAESRALPKTESRRRQDEFQKTSRTSIEDERMVYRRENQADPLCRVTGPRMNPSVDVGRPPRPFRHLRMAEHRAPDPSSSRAPVHSALVQISVTRHHQPRRSAFRLDARQFTGDWQVEDRKKMAGGLLRK
jgi:hypothetical protein